MTAKKSDLKNDEFRMEFSSVSTLFLAEILGVTSDAVTRLARAGIIKQNGKARGKYDLFDAVNAYLDYLRENKGSDAGTRLKVEQERKLRLQNDKRENELVSTSDAAEVFRAASLHWKSIADGLPKRIASRLAKIENPDEIRMIVREALDGMYYEFEKGLDLR